MSFVFVKQTHLFHVRLACRSVYLLNVIYWINTRSGKWGEGRRGMGGGVVGGRGCNAITALHAWLNIYTQKPPKIDSIFVCVCDPFKRMGS